MRNKLAIGVGLFLVISSGLTALVWFTCRIYVPENMCATLIRKTGVPVPDKGLIATEPGQKGIQKKVLGPGRHLFYNPITWKWELHPLTHISAGRPGTWPLHIHSLSEQQRDLLRTGRFKFQGDFPKIGVVTRKIGSAAPDGSDIVARDSGHKGILREVLTPGTYKINPLIYEVEEYPAIVIPAGFVGVVTNMVDEPGVAGRASATPAAATEDTTDSEPTTETAFVSSVRPLAEPGRRGTLRDVLQPGIYFINPWLKKVTLVEIGFNEFSQLKVSEDDNMRISFPSDSGYLIRVGVTVVWGIDPKHAAEIVNEFGNIDRVLDKVIGPQLRSICRNIGSTYAARDFIQGEKRELFQKELTESLRQVCKRKHIEILLALVREIEVHAPDAGGGADYVQEDLKRTIQQSHIAIENRLTKEKQRDAAVVKAELEEEQKKIEITRETILAETRVMVANIAAEADKDAAEIDAQASLEIATIQEDVAKLDAQRIEILGKAAADVQKMEKQAEADGYRMLIEAFGSPKAYNLYTFAQNFEPESIRLFYAGEGTFWTDLTRFEEVGAAKLLQPAARGENPGGR
ncbi:MAG: hypothetical protein IID36_01660 [Planctomycetes bacterium]|nr:hypothetical protein [Planctomycetota bacterium]